MCGEVEDERRNDDEIVARLLYIAGDLGITRETLTARNAAPLTSDEARPAYMADLFRRVLNHAISGRLTASTKLVCSKRPLCSPRFVK